MNGTSEDAGFEPKQRVDRLGGKLSQTLRIDPDVLAYFKGCGRGWQSRINAVLREAMERGRQGDT